MTHIIDLLQEAMNVLGFTAEQKMSLFRTIAAVLHFGNIEVKQRPREEQAEISNTSGELIIIHTV